MLDLSTTTYGIINAKQVTSIYLYELTYSVSEEPLYWTSYDEDVSYDSKTYTKFPITHEDINEDSDGQINELVVNVANADRTVQYYVENYSLMWKNFKIRQIFIGTSECVDHNFLIKGVKCKKDIAAITLSSGVDVLALAVPNRKLISNFCSWVFKDGNCAYTGSDTVCEKTFDDCKAKSNLTHFGGFPAMIKNNFYF